MATSGAAASCGRCSTVINTPNLTAWTTHLYPAINCTNAASSGADWAVGDEGTSVLQTIDGQQTMFCSDFTIFDEDAGVYPGPGVTITGQVKVEDPPNTEDRDNDYWGFALGFNGGDEGPGGSSSDADYVLIDWMRAGERHSASCRQNGPGSSGSDVCERYPGYDPDIFSGGGANLPVEECGPVQCQNEDNLPEEWNQATVGLAASQVRGLTHADLMWSHQVCPAIDNDEGNFSTGYIQELKRGQTFGSKEWEYTSPSKEWYDFRFDISSRIIRVYVDDCDTPEMTISATELVGRNEFNVGHFCFYNFAQKNVRYSGFTVEPICPENGDTPTPQPTSTSCPGQPLCFVEDCGILGDDQCDGGDYNTAACGWDGGDCRVPDYPDCLGVFPSLVGDGKCDGPDYNTTVCGYDGGDCLGSFEPTFQPTFDATGPTFAPTFEATGPTFEPTFEATGPTFAPTFDATGPTFAPTNEATGPTFAPTFEATGPTFAPTNEATGPTFAPTFEATGPTFAPTNEATGPTYEPTMTLYPTFEPTSEATGPTYEPTMTLYPTFEPTIEADPTEEPTADPTEDPTAVPTGSPTDDPTAAPTNKPTPLIKPAPRVCTFTRECNRRFCRRPHISCGEQCQRRIRRCRRNGCSCIATTCRRFCRNTSKICGRFGWDRECDRQKRRCGCIGSAT